MTPNSGQPDDSVCSCTRVRENDQPPFGSKYIKSSVNIPFGISVAPTTAPSRLAFEASDMDCKCQVASWILSIFEAKKKKIEEMTAHEVRRVLELALPQGMAERANLRCTINGDTAYHQIHDF